MENELYHHGVKGQKWGVRRYQNKDGSLTYAGKKRALKMQDQYTRFSKNKKYRDKDGNFTYAGRKKKLKMEEKYSELTGKQLRKQPSKNASPATSGKTKSINEMSNAEIQAKIDRIRLENTLKSLTPEHVSTGQKIANGVKDASISIIRDKGAKIIGDYIDKKVRDKLGLSNKQAKTASEILREKAQDYENRQKVDKGQQYFKEGKYAESKSKNEKQSKTETYTGTVKGEGTSKRTTSKNKTNASYYDEPIDAEWREVNDSDINNGRSYVNQYLLEDKKHK